MAAYPHGIASIESDDCYQRQNLLDLLILNSGLHSVSSPILQQIPPPHARHAGWVFCSLLMSLSSLQQLLLFPCFLNGKTRSAPLLHPPLRYSLIYTGCEWLWNLSGPGRSFWSTEPGKQWHHFHQHWLCGATIHQAPWWENVVFLCKTKLKGIPELQH